MSRRLLLTSDLMHPMRCSCVLSFSVPPFIHPIFHMWRLPGLVNVARCGDNVAFCTVADSWPALRPLPPPLVSFVFPFVGRPRWFVCTCAVSICDGHLLAMNAGYCSWFLCFMVWCLQVDLCIHPLQSGKLVWYDVYAVKLLSGHNSLLIMTKHSFQHEEYAGTSV